MRLFETTILICEKSPTNSFDRQKKILFIRQGTQCNGQCVLYNMLLYGSSHNCGKKQDRIISFFSVIKGQFWPFYVSDFWWTSTCRLFQVKRAAAGLGTCPGQGGRQRKGFQGDLKSGPPEQACDHEPDAITNGGGMCERKTGARSHLQILWKKVSQGFL